MAWVRTAIRWLRTRVISPKRVRIHLARSGTSVGVQAVSVVLVLKSLRHFEIDSVQARSTKDNELVLIVAGVGRRNLRRVVRISLSAAIASKRSLEGFPEASMLRKNNFHADCISSTSPTQLDSARGAGEERRL